MTGPDDFQATPRFLPLTGTLNTRDLGGVPVPGHGTTRLGVFYRSDVPMGLSAPDKHLLRELGVTTVIDLRQDYELERDPNDLHAQAGIDYRNIQISRYVTEGGGRPADKYDIGAFYVAALDHAGAGFRDALNVLADARGAALFHCTAGKDRTGVLAALVLELVGVARADVITDFSLTHDRIEPLRKRLLVDAESRGEDPQEFARLLGATPDLITPALDHLDSRYGGATAYLRGVGVPERVLERIREKLLA